MQKRHDDWKEEMERELHKESDREFDPVVAELQLRKLMRSMNTPVDRGPSMLLDQRMAAYFQAVHTIEANNSLDGDVMLTRLYNACKPLVPDISNAGLFPPLRLISDGPLGSLVPKLWKMELKRETRASLVITGESIKTLSVTLFHETRHVEQMWMEIHVRHQSGQQIPRITKDMRILADMVETLLAVPLPTGADTAHLVSWTKITAEERVEHQKIIQEFLKITSQITDISLEVAMDVPDAKEKHGKLMVEAKAWEKRYRAIPDEADAFLAQAIYEDFYKYMTGEQ